MLTGSVVQLLRNTKRRQEWQEAISQVAVPLRGGAVPTPSKGTTSAGDAHHFTTMHNYLTAIQAAETRQDLVKVIKKVICELALVIPIETLFKTEHKGIFASLVSELI